jgi:hypothetical protein
LAVPTGPGAATWLLVVNPVIVPHKPTRFPALGQRIIANTQLQTMFRHHHHTVSQHSAAFISQEFTVVGTPSNCHDHISSSEETIFVLISEEHQPWANPHFCDIMIVHHGSGITPSNAWLSRTGRPAPHSAAAAAAKQF